MPGLGEQRQAVRLDACDNQQHDVGQRDRQRGPQHPGNMAAAVRVTVHTFSLESFWGVFNLSIEAGAYRGITGHRGGY
jgi:hypothetical protein